MNASFILHLPFHIISQNKAGRLLAKIFIYQLFFFFLQLLNFLFCVKSQFVGLFEYPLKFYL